MASADGSREKTVVQPIRERRGTQTSFRTTKSEKNEEISPIPIPAATGPIPECTATATNSKEESDRDVDTIAVPSDEDAEWQVSPQNPRNFSLRKKWTMTSIVSMYAFVTPLASSMMAPGLGQTAEQYNITNPTVVALTLSIFQLSFAMGPLVLAPMTEIYGRTWVLHLANLFFLGFNIGCAFSPTVGALIGFRFLSGLVGGAPIAIGGGTVSDLFAERERAAALSLYTLGPLGKRWPSLSLSAGPFNSFQRPVIGPIAGGFVAQTIGPKYVFLVIAGLCAFTGIFALPLLRETYAPVIRQRLIKNSDAEMGASKVSLNPLAENKWSYIWQNISRPMILLTHSLICFALSGYMAFIYGIFYLMFTIFANFFNETYGFGPGIGGLMYLGLGVGFFISTAIGGRLMNTIYIRMADKNGGKGLPEYRIPALIFGSIVAPIGLFWFGWSAQAKLHWIMPVIGSGIFGFALMATFLPIQLYLVDAFTYAASAFSAAGVFRSLLGFAFPLFAQRMFDALDIGPGMSLLAGLSIVIGIPFPLWLYYKGAEMRAKNSLTR